jgi:hypothetical protein
VITRDHTRILQTADAFGYRWCRQVNTTTKLVIGQSGISLKLVQQWPIGIVERSFHTEIMQGFFFPMCNQSGVPKSDPVIKTCGSTYIRLGTVRFKGVCMVSIEPRAERSIATNGVSAVTAWPEARTLLEEARTYWLATVRPDGAPHLVPLFGVLVDDALYFTSSPGARKARDLEHDGRCVLGATGEGLDVQVEGMAVRVQDEATLVHVADAYRSKYGWELRVRTGAYDADFGAPSAGPPPYALYKIAPTVAFGLGTAEPYGATRWRF